MPITNLALPPGPAGHIVWYHLGTPEQYVVAHSTHSVRGYTNVPWEASRPLYVSLAFTLQIAITCVGCQDSVTYSSRL